MTNGVEWIGHATCLITLGGQRFLTDPMLSSRVGVVLGRHQPPSRDAAAVLPLAGILVSHAHLDHLDLPSLRALRTAGASCPVVVAAGFEHLIRKVGFDDVRTLRWHESTTLPSGATVSAIPATHFPGRSPLLRGTLYQGYVVAHAGRQVMFAGDTGPCDHYAAVGERFAIDCALLPIGAYSPPPFRRVHMAPEDALDAMEALRARAMVPIHHSTFRLSTEPMSEPPRRLMTHAEQRGLAARVKLLRHGDRFALP